ncbi:MAG: ABC transporter substrate-binding protein [Elusimicrobia bacterium]|nr:ABC transporter substrate-binding protein [Elusimicrobiota bacterium]
MPVKNPDTYTYATISDADSLDPAWSYDTASHHHILNLYEPLFGFDGASTEKFVGLVASQVPSRANGLLAADGRTYKIPIRKGIKFHDGTPLTPEDVRYSLLRFLLLDRDAGPSWMLIEPLLGYHSTRDEKGRLNPDAFKDAAKAVQVQGDAVVLRLPKPFAPLTSILASWAVVVSKDWMTKNGGWNGAESTWAQFNNPKKESSPIHEKAMGTGPWKLERWDRRTKEVLFVRNDGYWRKPAKLARVLVKSVNEFSTRRLMLQAGDVDAIYASAPEFTQVQGLPGVEIVDGLAMVDMNPTAFFTFKINPSGNPNIGSGKLDGEGIPVDFFNDVDVRKGFAHSVDYQGYIKDVFRGQATQATGCIPKTLPGHNPRQAAHVFDLAKAKAHFQKAWGGQVWEKGFKFTMTFNIGNAPRQTLGQMIKRSVESLNPKFQIDVRSVEWPTFLDGYRASKFPLFLMGWNADFPDAHSFAFPMMHSAGDFPAVQGYKNERADALVAAAAGETNPAKRKQLYAKLQAIEFEDVPHLVIIDSTRYRTQRTWVKGWQHNPMFPDAPYGTYFYTLWKE